uniref:GCVT N-terminal domain-containing protein n=1 Tax=Solanum lycopersicum TaxID=4081 RepID=A0A3Q7EQE6_SOLLC
MSVHEGHVTSAKCFLMIKGRMRVTDLMFLHAFIVGLLRFGLFNFFFLQDTMTIAGAKVSEDGVIGTFDNDEEALDAVENGVAVVDLSHYGRIRVSGEDRVQFLHNQSTANFEILHEGQGCDTVFVTPTARTIDIAHAWVMKTAITLVVSPVTRERITHMLEKYIFFADKVEIQDITEKTSLFLLVGPTSNKIMEALSLADIVGQPYGSHKHYNVIGFLPL